MRVLSVVPRYAVTVGSLQGGTVIGKTPEERGSCINKDMLYITQTLFYMAKTTI